MTNSVIRHYGTDRTSVPHPATSNQCRTTLDPAKVTCRECIEAPPPQVVPGEVIAATIESERPLA